ncbi:hypothetical protein SAMN02745704_00108 [Paucidesulfovibrio gracilis DSM 16080]|uniref:Outer membrane protease n=1 Tax=Paucidesulfovibrio gracilis DSM 16080 TaxID=1121449 RepID=A0A1T4W290_9BACT|nr:hypothetical protein [Paucidesulfovibrio gracilis]SKA71259.1 hypothetical protein SAMN02745704_00108 [Paucidesulfovibrio gracilis DSM 16080]
MFMRKRKLAFFICAGLSLILLLAAHARADDGADNATDWYFGAGISLYVVDVPDYAPVWDVEVSGLGPLTISESSRITLAGGPIAAPLFEATLGKELDDQWFVETRFEYAYVKNRSSHSNWGSDPALTHGTVFFPLDGVDSNTRGLWSTAQMELEFEFQQYGAALVAGKTFSGDDWHIRPFAGLWFQERDTTYRMDFGDGGFNVPTYFVDDIETMYRGLLVGVGLTLPMNGWAIELETTHGVASAHTQYSGFWDTITSLPGTSSDLSLDKYEWAYRGTLQASVSIPVSNGWEFGLTGGLRYLSYVPRLMSSGQANDAKLAGPAHLVGESSFSGKLGLEIVYSF